MKKNILIIGASRCGKTSLARKLHTECDYSVISIDDIISGLAAYPTLNICHNGDRDITAQNLAPFLEKYLIELSEGPNFYSGVKFAIEGSYVDFERLMPFVQSEKYRRKYEIIGLTINEETPDELYQNIRKHDTEDDWTFWLTDEDLMKEANGIVAKNQFFLEKFEKYHIKSYDTSHDREMVLKTIITDLRENGSV